MRRKPVSEKDVAKLREASKVISKGQLLQGLGGHVNNCF